MSIQVLTGVKQTLKVATQRKTRQHAYPDSEQHSNQKTDKAKKIPEGE
jgi:hypothetical protein